MNHTWQRNRLRTVLSGAQCVSPAGVYDPLSARAAESVGFEIGVLTGALASTTTLAAPDLIVLTLTEFAEQIRRITRVANLSLIVDADHGYGNALNVMRTVQELEHAGVSALTIEDTRLPRQFRQPANTLELISAQEMVGKLRAAVAARSDPALVIAGRTSLRINDLAQTVARAEAYAATGIDALFIVGLENLEQLEAIHAKVKLPLMVSPPEVPLASADLAARGARVVLQGHHPLWAAVKALRETYMHLFNGGTPGDLKSRIASDKEMAALSDAEIYAQRQRDYLQ